MEQMTPRQEKAPEYSTELLSQEAWTKNKDEIIALVLDCFPQYIRSAQDIEDEFVNQHLGEQDVVVLLKDIFDKKIVGLTVAVVYKDKPDTANIEMTGIISEKRNQGLVGKLMDKLETELKHRGVKFVTRKARINDGYADAVVRHYEDRILETKDYGV